MKILLVSDTHGNHEALLKAFAAAGQPAMLIHLGDGAADTSLFADIEDCELLQVAGNCDPGSTLPRELIYECGSIRLMLCHGDRYGVKTGLSRLIERGHETDVNAVLYGHTHIAMAEQQEGLWLINPGTLSWPALFRSFAILEINNNGIEVSIHQLK